MRCDNVSPVVLHENECFLLDTNERVSTRAISSFLHEMHLSFGTINDERIAWWTQWDKARKKKYNEFWKSSKNNDKRNTKKKKKKKRGKKRFQEQRKHNISDARAVMRVKKKEMFRIDVRCRRSKMVDNCHCHCNNKMNPKDYVHNDFNNTS